MVKYFPDIGKLEYIEIAPPAQSHPTNMSTWEDWDLSGFIPAGAKYAEILMKSDSNGLMTMGVRENGSSLDRYHTMASDTKGEIMVWTVKLDSGRIVERYGSDGIDKKGYFTVVGYWK